jgi:F420-0:gamma-glutamyl ligase-like protein
MENFKLYGLLYELKGMVKSASDLENHDDNYYNPMIENIDVKMNEIIQEIEKKSA